MWAASFLFHWLHNNHIYLVRPPRAVYTFLVPLGLSGVTFSWRLPSWGCFPVAISIYPGRPRKEITNKQTNKQISIYAGRPRKEMTTEGPSAKAGGFLAAPEGSSRGPTRKLLSHHQPSLQALLQGPNIF
jgi:hypothetical protein